MLTRPHRLKKAKDFQRVFQGGRGAKEGTLFVKVRESKREVSRIGIVVSKKVSKKAVTRNRIKRVLSEALRKKIKDIQGSKDIVIVTLPGCEIKSLREAEVVLLSLLKKAKLI